MDSEMKEMFIKIKDELMEEQVVREEIREIVQKLEIHYCEMLSALQQTHLLVSDIEDELSKFKKTIESSISPNFKLLASKINNTNYYKYHDAFRFTTQRIVFVVAFAYFLEHHSLISRNIIANLIGLETDPLKGAHLDLEDYLQGILNLASELVRYAVNAFVAGDNKKPFQIADFVTLIDTNFRLLNLKNDVLRRRYDVLKYDVQKAEQMVFDLTVRGFKRP